MSAPVGMARRRDPWTRLAHLVRQEPLFETQPSLAALSHLPRGARPPSAVFLGIGVASPAGVSRALPLDVLGMLLCAERARRVLGASEMIVLLADAHAVCNGFSAVDVERCAARYDERLRRALHGLGFDHTRLLRARSLHARDDYRALHRAICGRAPRSEHAYVTREVADIAYFDRSCGGIVKVGWALGARRGTRADERAFDERFARWVGSNVGFVYCKAGRALDDRRRKAPPYIEPEPEHRLCLSSDEVVSEKLERAGERASHCTVRGVRRHLKAIARSYRELVRPLDGPIEAQVQAMLEDLTSCGAADAGAA